MSELNCQGCGGGCCNGSMFDTVFIYEDEVKRLRSLGAKITKNASTSFFSMHVKGGCMFLKKGRCSIYEKRPISCQNYDCRPEEERWEEDGDDEDVGW
jgi:Fe-S-cluster containining protein